MKKDHTPAALAVLIIILLALLAVSILNTSAEAKEYENTYKEQTRSERLAEAENEGEEEYRLLGYGRDVPALLHGADGVTAYAWELEECADIVYLEAGGESEECYTAVTEVIFNRLKSGIWGSTLHSVLSADGQFETYENADGAETTEEVREAVMEVFENGCETDGDVMFFRSDYYHEWDGAVDEFEIDGVYFSSSRWCADE